MIAAKLGTEPKERKDDATNLLILIFIASLLGVYLITTTVLIADDGVYYIELAQKFSSDPVGVIKGHPFGYPFLIFIAHKFVTLFSNSSSVYSWIYSAQSITLLCRLLAIIPLYFIGKEFVGRKLSFWAILVLIVLPYPAKTGADALRDWPYILFLTAGFLFLLLGANQGKWWLFGVAGLTAGLGHIIRPECVQLVVYGGLWLAWNLVRPKRGVTRAKLALALVVLVAGFCIPAGLYMRMKGKILPGKAEALIGSAQGLQSDEVSESRVDKASDGKDIAAVAPTNVVKAFGELANRVSENLMYFFVPALLIGIYYHFRKQPEGMERFFVAAFVLFNVTILVLLYCISDYMSRRHALPLAVMTIFYVPVGLEVIAGLLERKRSESRSDIEAAKNRSGFWFFVLVAVGVTICLPKLLRPIRVDKKGYRAAAAWLKNNTFQGDLIAVSDSRVSLYAEREAILVTDDSFPASAEYVVKVKKVKDEQRDLRKDIVEEYSVYVDEKKKERKLLIYRVRR